MSKFWKVENLDGNIVAKILLGNPQIKKEGIMKETFTEFAGVSLPGAAEVDGSQIKIGCIGPHPVEWWMNEFNYRQYDKHLVLVAHNDESRSLESTTAAQFDAYQALFRKVKAEQPLDHWELECPVCGAWHKMVKEPNGLWNLVKDHPNNCHHFSFAYSRTCNPETNNKATFSSKGCGDFSIAEYIVDLSKPPRRLTAAEIRGMKAEQAAETMKVVINKCPGQRYWYWDFVGQGFLSYRWNYTFDKKFRLNQEAGARIAEAGWLLANDPAYHKDSIVVWSAWARSEARDLAKNYNGIPYEASYASLAAGLAALGVKI